MKKRRPLTPRKRKSKRRALIPISSLAGLGIGAILPKKKALLSIFSDGADALKTKKSFSAAQKKRLERANHLFKLGKIDARLRVYEFSKELLEMKSRADLEIKGVRAELTQKTRELEEKKRELEAAKRKLRGEEGKLELSMKTYEAANDKLEALLNMLKPLQTDFKEIRTRFNTLQGSNQRLTTENNEMKGKMKKMRAEEKRLRTEIDRSAKEIEAKDKNLDARAKEIDELRVKVEGLEISVGQKRRIINDLGNQLTRAIKNAREAEEKLQTEGKKSAELKIETSRLGRELRRVRTNLGAELYRKRSATEQARAAERKLAETERKFAEAAKQSAAALQAAEEAKKVALREQSEKSKKEVNAALQKALLAEENLRELNVDLSAARSAQKVSRRQLGEAKKKSKALALELAMASASAKAAKVSAKAAVGEAAAALKTAANEKKRADEAQRTAANAIEEANKLAREALDAKDTAEGKVKAKQAEIQRLQAEGKQLKAMESKLNAEDAELRAQSKLLQAKVQESKKESEAALQNFKEAASASAAALAVAEMKTKEALAGKTGAEKGAAVAVEKARIAESKLKKSRKNAEKAKKRAIAAEYSAAVNQSLIDTQALQILGLEEEIRREKLKHDKKVAEFIQKQNMSEAKITDLESRGLANAEQIAAIEKKREEERERLEALEKERKDLEQKVNAGRDLKRAIRAIGKNYTKERDRANKAEAALKRGFDKEKTCEMATANWENTKNTPDEKEIFWSVLENLGCVTKGQDTEVSNEKTRNVSMVAPPRGSVAMKKKLSKEEITRIRKEWEMAEQKEAGDRLKQSQEASREEVQNRYDEMERMIPGSKAQRMRGVPKTSTKQRRKAKKVKKPTRTQLGYLIKQLQRRLQRNSSAIKNLPEDAFRGSRKSGFSKVETRGVEQPKIAEKKKLSMKEALDALESKRNTVYKNLTKDEFYSQIYIPTFDRIQTQLKAEERNKLKKISK